MGETSLEQSLFPHHPEVLPENRASSQVEIMEDDPFEGEELLDLQASMNRIDVPCSAEDYIVGEGGVAVCFGLIDYSKPNWREEVRAEILGDDVKVLPTADDDLIEDADFDKEVEQPAIKSLTEAMKLREKLLNSRCPL